jgi:hypothetical protein
MINSSDFGKALNYAQYRSLIETLLAEGKSTGLNQSADYLEYSKINLQRMQRIEKTTVLTEEMQELLKTIKGNYTWVVLTEGWCGDAAQNLPALHSIEKACPTIGMKFLLRDKHLSIMDQYLTNGSRSIPKLICLEKESLKELFVWGPRPAKLQELVMEMIKNQVPKSERGIVTQKWYNEDKTLSLQAEFVALIRNFCH